MRLGVLGKLPSLIRLHRVSTHGGQPNFGL